MVFWDLLGTLEDSNEFVVTVKEQIILRVCFLEDTSTGVSRSVKVSATCTESCWIKIWEPEASPLEQAKAG